MKVDTKLLRFLDLIKSNSKVKDLDVTCTEYFETNPNLCTALCININPLSRIAP